MNTGDLSTKHVADTIYICIKIRNEMKKLLLISLMLLTVLSMAACEGSDDEPFTPGQSVTPGQPETPDVSSLAVNITAGDRTVTATMEDNAAARDFLSRLPLEVTLNDYNNVTEKIFYPSPALTTGGVTRGCTPVPGDITIYVPWGNVAIFCKSWSHSNDLIKIGRIDGNGIGVLGVAGDISVKFERR
jgi:flavodoxin